MYFIIKFIILMVILVFSLVISVNRRLFRYFGSDSGISVIPVILVNRRTPLRSHPSRGAFDLPESESGFEIMILIHRFI